MPQEIIPITSSAILHFTPGRYYLAWVDEHGVSQRQKAILREHGVNDTLHVRTVDAGWSIPPDSQWVPLHTLVGKATLEREKLPISIETGRDDIAPSGMIHWEDMAKQLANVWWEVSKVGGTLQHGDLDKAETMFSVVLEQHGGHCFHGETPMDAWRKASAWLVAPERPRPSQVAIEIAARVWCDDEMAKVTMDTDAAFEIAKIIDRVRAKQDSLDWEDTCDRLLNTLQTVIDSSRKRTYEEMKAVSERLTAMGSAVAGMELGEYEP